MYKGGEDQLHKIVLWLAHMCLPLPLCAHAYSRNTVAMVAEFCPRMVKGHVTVVVPFFRLPEEAALRPWL